jgi:YHS domain-containing protein
MPKDPVCGHYVDKSTPYKQEHDGETYYFCCLDCMEEYEYGVETMDEVGDESIDVIER